MKTYKYINLIAILGSILLSSCLFESEDDPGDPCDGVECNEPFEISVATATTVCQCTCAPGFSGPDCKDFDATNCEALQCQNGGEKLRDGDFCFCSCPEGWGGLFCEIPASACSGVQCPEGQSPNPDKDCTCE